MSILFTAETTTMRKYSFIPFFNFIAHSCSFCKYFLLRISTYIIWLLLFGKEIIYIMNVLCNNLNCLKSSLLPKTNFNCKIVIKQKKSQCTIANQMHLKLIWIGHCRCRSTRNNLHTMCEQKHVWFLIGMPLI